MYVSWPAVEIIFSSIQVKRLPDQFFLLPTYIVFISTGLLMLYRMLKLNSDTVSTAINAATSKHGDFLTEVSKYAERMHTQSNQVVCMCKK